MKGILIDTELEMSNNPIASVSGRRSGAARRTIFMKEDADFAGGVSVEGRIRDRIDFRFVVESLASGVGVVVGVGVGVGGGELEVL